MWSQVQTEDLKIPILLNTWLNGADPKKGKHNCDSQFVLLQFIVHVCEHDTSSLLSLSNLRVIITKPIRSTIVWLHLMKTGTSTDSFLTIWAAPSVWATNEATVILVGNTVSIRCKCAQNEAGHAVRTSGHRDLSPAASLAWSQPCSQWEDAAAAGGQAAGNLHCTLTTRGEPVKCV